MNEHKIRLIADKATEWCNQNAHGAPKSWEWEMKFAELIVKECISELETSIQGNPYTGETYDDDEVNAIIINNIESIKEHFGVE